MTLQEQLESGLSHHRAGRLEEAERIYREILSQQPDNADALHLLGMLMAQLGQRDAGMNLIRRAIAIYPTSPIYHSNLGNLLTAANQFEQAVESCRQAIRIDPNSAEAHTNLGNALISLGKLDEATACYGTALRINPELAETQNNLGNALQKAGLFEEAIQFHRNAIRLKPQLAEAHNNLGDALSHTGKLDESIAAYRQAIDLNPGYAEAHYNLGLVLGDMGQHDEAISHLRQAMRIKPDDVVAHSALILTLHYHPDRNPKMIHDELRSWNNLHALAHKRLIQPYGNSPDPNRRLRIGYVSADFFNHASALFMLPLFRHHNRDEFELFLYAQGDKSDSVTRQIMDQAQCMRRITGMSDAKVAAQIREDGIDILVDLKLHSAANRLLVFAQKPAPVQATWLGYPGSTGLDTIDYRVTDPFLDPPGFHDGFYSERSIRLPDTFWCYDSHADEPRVNSLPRLETGFIIFGCLNSFCKINDGLLSLWARILRATGNSRLLMLAPKGSARDRVLAQLGREGVDSGRVEFVAKQSHPDYLRTHQRIDIGLDPFPWGGGITTCDALWMGVPVVSLRGRTAVGRGGASILANIGLTDLVALSAEEYVSIAVALATDLPRLAELRRTMRPRMQASPLMDAPRFARNMEAAYRQMWRNWCAGGAG